ncbi:cystathionine beta-synthase [Colletotrichum costaricense]|uniref:cystathionine beta-synthase n=1 Tax=Colletotrichum costaricense TaxID=1209916 RepID=A0AAI9YFU0_9PEZI|nr:cystathionine beta-synthase [Colletotrichum costaricense]KAK1507830.1 cystathionine beta-synthase [Colletotrichum costaricense]
MAAVPLPPITDSVIHHIGNTPLVRLKHLPQTEGIRAEILAKLEYQNAGGSVKDRVAKAMIEKAEDQGTIKPGDTLIEATSGNTGIALALIAAVKGYKCIITISEKMSEEKVLILKALGATIVRTPAGVPIDSPHSIISVARKLKSETPNSHILNQYGNPNNPLAHEIGTAQELWAQCDGKLDIVIAGAGTGGTVTGLSRGLRKLKGDILMVGADPIGSVLAQPDDSNSAKAEYKVEGIGYDFVPDVLDQFAADVWVKTGDEESFEYARRLIREEGLLCGGSSGAAVAALIKLMQQRPEMNRSDVRVVLILPDGIRNYLTKFVDDAWMARNPLSS